MEKDTKWKTFFEDNRRYADIINGLGCGGRQLVSADDLQEEDSTSGKRSRDTLRRAALGMNFVIVGIENQEKPDYGVPFRNMAYDVGVYGKQVAKIRREVRDECAPESFMPGEYLYGFKKDSRLHPVITFVLYSGEESWDGARSLHGILDFTDVPESLKDMTPDYKINIIEIRKQMEKMQQESKEKGEKTDMCKAIKDLMEDSRAEGLAMGREVGLAEGMRKKMVEMTENLLKEGVSMEIIVKVTGLMKEEVREIEKNMLVLQ